MASIEYEVIIKTSPQVVYDISQDYSIRYQWDPFPEKVAILDGSTKIEKGSRVFVLARNKMKMLVEFVQVLPPTITAIKMIEGPFFLKSFAGSWIFKPADNGDTRAIFKYSIKLKRWTVPMITEFIACRYFGSAVKNRLNGLKYYCEEKS